MHDSLRDLRQMVIARFKTAVVATNMMDNPDSYIEAAIDGLTTYLEACQDVEVLDLASVFGDRLRA